MSVNIAAIKELRENTGAGIMDCRRALEAADGDKDKAAAVLKEQGLSQARKRRDREANEGRVFLRTDRGKAVLLRLACETDFVARNADFVRLGEECLARAFDGSEGPGELSRLIEEAIGRIRENILLCNLKTLTTDRDERLFGYLHGEGRIGSVVRLSVNDSAAWERQEAVILATDLALHVAAFGPLFLTRDAVDPGYLAQKEAEFLSEARSLGKPEAMIAAIARGKMDKHLARICMLEQGFLRDETTSVEETLGRLRTQGGPDVRVTGFLHDRVGP